MRLISDRIVSYASCDCGISIFLVNSLDWDFDFASHSGTALAASVLSWTIGILHFVAELNSENILTASSHLHLDCGTCLCTFTRLSPTLLMNCGWRNSAVFCFTCACSCGAGFITETVSSKIGSGTRTWAICSSIHSGASFVCVLPSSLVWSMSHNV